MVLRRLLLIVAAASADLLAWRGLATDRAVAQGASLADLVTALAAWALQAGLAWCTVLVVLLALEPVARRELTGFAACPPGVRRLLLLACGAVTIASIAGTAQADAPDGPATHQVVRTGARPAVPLDQHLDGLPLPDRTTDGSTPTAAAVSAAAVTVRPGDSLWRIAAERLAREHPGREPSATEIDRAWHAWYAANRARLGDDPDLILPGTALQDPPSSNGDDR